MDYADFRHRVDRKYAHFRRYDRKSLTRQLEHLGFEIIKVQYSASFFGAWVQNIVHTFSVFEWHKEVETNYRFRQLVVFPLTFPFFYLGFLLDRWLPGDDGFAIVVTARKLEDKRSAVRRQPGQLE